MNKYYPMRNSVAFENGLRDLIQYINTYEPVNQLNMIEIGSYIGESTIIFASSFKQVTSVDPYIDNYDPTDHACKFAPFEQVYRQFLSNTKQFSNITQIRKTSDDAVLDFEPNSIDFVYIDGNHTYEFVKKDIENYLNIVKLNGFIAGHDYQHEPIKQAIFETIGNVDRVFSDTSWVKKVKIN